jgi:uncharacterized membrane-anchored protein
MENKSFEKGLSKVPQLTLLFWIIKIAATTLGETGGDAVSMSMNLGYLTSTFIFAAIFFVAVYYQIKAPKFHPIIYWLTIIATTTVGTTLADFVDRSLGIGYTGGSAILLALVLGSLFLWHKVLGSISVESVSNPKSEMFYWLTIMFSQTLGTALGGLLALVVILYYRTRVSRTILFWAAFILTRPLGAVVGDFLDKPVAKGGLALSRYSATAALFAFMLACILFFPHKAADKAH